jgi:hypothetical protein
VIILRDGEVLHQARLDEAAGGGRRLVIGLRNAPAEMALMALPPVASAKRLDVGNRPKVAGGARRFRVELADGARPDQLAAAIVGKGWGLLELRTESSDLERIYFRSIGAERAA